MQSHSLTTASWIIYRLSRVSTTHFLPQSYLHTSPQQSYSPHCIPPHRCLSALRPLFLTAIHKVWSPTRADTACQHSTVGCDLFSWMFSWKINWHSTTHNPMAGDKAWCITWHLNRFISCATCNWGKESHYWSTLVCTHWRKPVPT